MRAWPALRPLSPLSLAAHWLLQLSACSSRGCHRLRVSRSRTPRSLTRPHPLSFLPCPVCVRVYARAECAAVAAHKDVVWALGSISGLIVSASEDKVRTSRTLRPLCPSRPSPRPILSMV